MKKFYRGLCLWLSLWLIGGVSPLPLYAETAAPTVAAFPFSTDFESGVLDADFATYTSGVGRAELAQDAPHTGSYSVFLGKKTTGAASASLVLTVDLANQPDVYVDFWVRATGTANDPDSGLYISTNEGATWTKLLGLGSNRQFYGHEYINLTDAAADRGLVLHDRVHLSFFFESDRYQEVGGIHLDDLRLTTRAALVNPFPDQQPVSSPTFAQGLYPLGWGVGVAAISSDLPYSGAYSFFLGKKIGGDGAAYLHWLVDLTNQADVYLDFWWRAIGTANDGANGLYVSVDDGATWSKLLNLNANRQIYGHEYLNLRQALNDKGLIPNNRVQLSFHYQSDRYQAVGGLHLDELRLTTRAQIVSAFPMSDSLEDESFRQGLYPLGWGVGVAEINRDGPHTGSKQLFLGKKIQGDGAAYLHLVADLANQESAFLDFWWRATGTANHQANGIYLSVDHGITWHKILDLSGSPQLYTHQVVDLVTAANNRGLILGEDVRISLHYETDRYQAISGFWIDDLRLSTLDPSQPAPTVTPTPTLAPTQTPTPVPSATPKAVGAAIYLPQIMNSQ